MTRTMLAGAVAALAFAVPTGLLAQESYTVRGDRVAVYNLAGEVDLVAGDGDEVTVRVMRGGADGDALDVQIGEIDGRQTLRVVYPSDRIHYDGDGWGGRTDVQVRRDGTWGGGWRDRGDRVRISSRGSGLDAHADLRIEVPRGQEIDLHVAVGRITASSVDGRVRLGTHSGGVEARDMAGQLTIDTGSGSVDVVGMEGDLDIDTGSGSVRIADVNAERVGVDTGSGGVEGEGVQARRIEIDTGSGGIELRRSSARDVELDTGSGSVRAELATDIDRLIADTGSGSVTLRLPDGLNAELDIDTGSGGIEVDFPVMATHRERGELRGRIGDGGGRIEVDTGSGSVRIQRM
ncbi:MAG: DUF4097 family beta strand repeat-containing protein [Candidatus Longimicrobiales bacterium M2_2A_002]